MLVAISSRPHTRMLLDSRIHVLLIDYRLETSLLDSRIHVLLIDYRLETSLLDSRIQVLLSEKEAVLH